MLARWQNPVHLPIVEVTIDGLIHFPRALVWREKANCFVCNIARCGYVRYTDTWNVHMHRNPETLETQTTLGSSGTKLLLPSWLLGFSTRRERDTHTISTMLTVPSNPTMRGHPIVHNWTGFAQVQKSTRFVQLQISTNCFFSKITENPQPIASGHDVPNIPCPISLSGVFIMTSVILSHPPRASVNTCAQYVLLPVH